jgi:hypothetical protein
VFMDMDIFLPYLQLHPAFSPVPRLSDHRFDRMDRPETTRRPCEAKNAASSTVEPHTTGTPVLSTEKGEAVLSPEEGGASGDVLPSYEAAVGVVDDAPPTYEDAVNHV